MKRLTSFAVSFVFILGLVAFGPPANAAGSHSGVSFNVVEASQVRAQGRPGCVTRREFRRVRRGMRIERVHRIFDTRGRLGSVILGSVTRDYNACTRFGAVSITYERRRVVSKFAIF